MSDDLEARIECPCCGRNGLPPGAELVTDGDPLACGCNGYFSVDTESEPEVVVGECDCEGTP